MSIKKIMPGPDGRISFSLNVAPVSLQASGKRKAELAKIIRGEMSRYGFYYSGEVAVEITWYGSEERRYEADSDPDVDNIVKPIIDAMSGVDGILFDDCQVQHVSCSWIDTNGEDVVDIEIDCPLNQYIEKGDIIFVKYYPALCFPCRLNSYQDKHLLESELANIQSSLKQRESLRSAGFYYAGKDVMPIQMLFHITRINKFEVVSYDEIDAYLNKYYVE